MTRASAPVRSRGFSTLPWLLPIVFLAAGCAHTSSDSPAQPAAQATAVAPLSSAPDATPGLFPKDRLNLAINLLEKGESTRAEVELKACLADTPDSKAARLLVSEIETPLPDLYPKAYFSITLRKNDTLSGLAATYLGDPLGFYGLARYNGIAEPRKIAIGQRIRIPATASAFAAPHVHLRNSIVDDPTDGTPTNIRSSALSSAIARPSPDANVQPAAVAKIELPLDPWDAFRAAVASGQYGVAAKDADVLSLGFGNGMASLVADTYLRAAAEEQHTDPVAAGTHAEKAGDIFLKSLKEPEKARTAFQLALSLLPADAAARSGLQKAEHQIADKYYRRGLIAFQHQNLDEAISDWNMVLAIDPNYRDAQLNRAQALQLKSNLQKLRG